MVESSSSNGLACAMRPRIHRAYLATSLMILGAGLVLSLLYGIPAQAQLRSISGEDVCSEAYLDGLPAPAPLNGAHRVVQLVNCSSQTLLGAAPAAHQSGKQGFPVLPREGTWVMQPYSPTCSSASPESCTNILTIDIPRNGRIRSARAMHNHVPPCWGRDFGPEPAVVTISRRTGPNAKRVPALISTTAAQQPRWIPGLPRFRSGLSISLRATRRSSLITLTSASWTAPA